MERDPIGLFLTQDHPKLLDHHAALCACCRTSHEHRLTACTV